MKTVSTYVATIYCGLRRGYSDEVENRTHLFELVQAFVDRVGLCVNITPLQFAYTRGSEPGFAIGLINYPRFPKKPEEIKKQAVELATLLKEEMGQNRVSIVCTDETIMLGDS